MVEKKIISWEMPKEIVLEVKDLHTSFSTDGGYVDAVNGISFAIEKGKTLGIVGESGSGKSVASLSILQLLEGTTANIHKGEIRFMDTDLLSLSKNQMRKIRGNRIAMVFQEPMTSLNPTMTIGAQIAEPIIFHQGKNKFAAWDKAVEMLELVGMPEPQKRAKQYPFQLSGGMRQRVMIAIALACGPDVLIADEPTTALDVTIQAQILTLMKRLQREMGTSIIMITHDLGVIAETCDHVAVMYCGKIVEYTDVFSLFTDPKHPYTKGLLESMPSHEEDSEENLKTIEGTVPSPYDLPPGCAFATRCPYAKDICNEAMPELTTIEGRQVRCLIYQSDHWKGEVQ
ncbi:MAG: ABC transporter ATP-binding protein [Defluviitaleaceae bacterium]|nr:ABC transporter ATP-binding protein [Defluviitaleaceae bacterium]